MSRYHFIGIGGIGMSAIARIIKQRGHSVQGSDQKESALISQLQKEGIVVSTEHKADLVESADIAVYSTDIPRDHIEFVRAKELNLPLFHRADLLDQCAREKKPLLVTGTHGKTTTSSLLAHLLLKADFDPSFVVGGIILNLQTNGFSGSGDFFVMEADESDGSFLKTKSFGAIVTNLENDHLSYWKHPRHLDAGFALFFSQVENPNHLFWCADDPRLQALEAPGHSYGFSSKANWQIQNFSAKERGISFDLFHENYLYKNIEVSLLGRHNALNSSAAFALALTLGADESKLREALRSFGGVHRRLEWKMRVKTIELFDDYGHHPTEIFVTLSALREKIGSKRLVAVFQPHRYSRVAELLDEFFLCFDEADVVILTDIYSAGEKILPHLFSKLHDGMKQKLGSKFHFFPKEKLALSVAQLLAQNDILLTIGAGDITHMGGKILQWV